MLAEAYEWNTIYAKMHYFHSFVAAVVLYNNGEYLLQIPYTC